MINYILLIIGLLLSSCGFNSAENTKEVVSSNESKANLVNKNLDSDGDFAKDYIELNNGTNPLVANIPKLDIKFLQDFIISINYKELETGVNKFATISSKTLRDDPNFKYKVGTYEIGSISQRLVAESGQFQGHTSAEISLEDLSWIKYPDIERRFHLKTLVELNQIFDRQKYEVTLINIETTNVVRLEENTGYLSISDLELNFKFYNYSQQSYELFKTVKINQEFLQGVNEVVKINLTNVPIQLIEENFLRRGELFLSEIKNYQIPNIDKDYKQLINRINSKTVPVVINNPKSTDIYHYATNEKGIQINEILSGLFDSSFKLLDNKISQVGEFKNNLGKFEFINEVKGESKKGKWFVLTNDINRDLYDHRFKNDDIIALTYSLGSDLGSQPESHQNFLKSINTEEETNHQLGNLTTNSLISINFRLDQIYGEEINGESNSISSDGGSCDRNCTRPKYRCDYQINRIDKVNITNFDQSHYNKFFNNTYLMFDLTEVNLSRLIEDKIAYLYIDDNHLFIEIRNFEFLEDFQNGDTIDVSLIIKPTLKKSFRGLKINSMSGPNSNLCVPTLVNYAGTHNVPISVDSKAFNQWQGRVNWSRLKKGHSYSYNTHFGVTVASIITNYYN